MNLEQKIFSRSIFNNFQNSATINKIRLQALARKAIRKCYDSETISLFLAQDYQRLG